MRYNATYHQQADKLAIENGFEFAVYMGHYHKDLAFVPYSHDIETEIAGFHCILIGEKHAKYRTFPSPPIGFPLDYDYLKKGRALYRELEKIVQTKNFDDPEWAYCNELYTAVTYGNWGNPPILKADLCLFLQEGKRLGRRIEIINGNIMRDGELYICVSNGNNYYLKLR